MNLSDDECIIIASELATKMATILFDGTISTSLEERFKISTGCLASLMAEFMYKMIDHKYPERRIELLSDVFHLSQKLFHVKDEQRKYNKKESH